MKQVRFDSISLFVVSAFSSLLDLTSTVREFEVMTVRFLFGIYESCRAEFTPWLASTLVQFVEDLPFTIKPFLQQKF